MPIDGAARLRFWGIVPHIRQKPWLTRRLSKLAGVFHQPVLATMLITLMIVILRGAETSALCIGQHERRVPLQMLAEHKDLHTRDNVT